MKAAEHAPEEVWIDYVDVDAIQLAAQNPKNHDRPGINESFNRFGAVMPPAINETTGRLFAGHGRVLTYRERKAAGQPAPKRVRVDGGRWLVPVLRGISFETDDAALQYLMVDNKLTEAGGWVKDAYEEIVDALEKRGAMLEKVGWKRTELDDIAASIEARASGSPAPVPSLRDRFLVPPFSVLDARQGYWKDRKAAWLAIGIKSEVGRGENLLKMSDTVLEPDPAKRAAMRARRGTNRAPQAASFGQDLMRDKGSVPSDGLGPGKRRKASARTFDTGAALGGGNFNDQVVGKRRDGTKAIGTQGWVQEKIAAGDIEGGMSSNQTGTSIFDPVLCELAYRWFAPQGGLVLDPFAGGSVRGVVAALLGLRYIGIDLREEQVIANRSQGDQLCAKIPKAARPRWVIGDSQDLGELVPAKSRQADLVFTCPPYADLERYSDDPRDLSTMAYDAFLVAFRKIIAAAVGSLRPDRFACVVVGDVRAPSGAYRDFPGDTVQAFRDAGAELYNDAILVTAIGSLPIRVGKQFVATRKLGKTHQQVYIFVKGDPRRATAACGKIEVEFPADLIVGGPPSGETIQ